MCLTFDKMSNTQAGMEHANDNDEDGPDMWWAHDDDFDPAWDHAQARNDYLRDADA